VRRFRFPVEAGAVLQFARAVADPSSVFASGDYLDSVGAGKVTPPPTFLISADQFDPVSPRRPSFGEAWPGSGRVGEGWRRPEGRGTGFHAEQVYEFRRHPRIGEVLTVEVADGRAWAKPGRQGSMQFQETVSRYLDADGAEVAVGRWVKVSIHPDLHRAQEETTPPPAARPVTSAAPGQDPAAAAGPPERITVAQSVLVGQRWSEVVVEDLTLSQLVRYAGASGDFIALHHDPDIARRAGYERVFGHGMLTMALSARVVSTLVGTDAIRRLSGRMRGVVHPGDTLTTTVTVESVVTTDQPTLELALRTTSATGQTVLTGTATAAVPA
jgi:acyl dehydratase